MRVVIATGIYPPDIGGPATHAADLARTLRARGHHVVVLSLTDGARTDGASDLVLFPRRWPWPVRTAAAAAWLVRHRRAYEVVYATGLELPAVAGSRLARRPVVLKVPGDVAWERASRQGLTTAGFDEFQDASGGGMRVRAMRGVRSWAARHASAVIVPSHHLLAAVERWVEGRAPVILVANGVQPPAGEATAAAAALDPGRHGLRLVFVGRLVAVKRVELLLDAIALADPSVTLEIVGDGPDRVSLEARAERLELGGRARFLGPLDHDDVMRRLAGADALVLASSHEGLPHVALEALVCGAPIVTTPVGGLVDLVVDDVNGVLVDQASPEAFAAVFDRLVDRPDLLDSLSAGARESGRAWEFDHCATQVEDLLLRLSRRRPRVVYVGRGACSSPPTVAERHKFAIHARHFRQLSIGSGPWARQDVSGVQVLFVPRLRSRLVGAVVFYAAAPALAVGAASGRRPGVVVCQSPFEGLGVVLARTLVPRRLRPRVQIELHGDWRTAARMYGSRWRRVIARPADAAATWALRRADRVRAVSTVLEDLARDAGYTGPLDRHITYSEFDVFLDAPPVDPPDRPVATFVGVMERYKAIDVLLDAWPAVVARVPDAQLLLVGAGSRQGEVERRLAEEHLSSVRRVDPMPQAELAAVLDQGSCLVLPSRSEGLARIVLEAMARGRPVVASDVGGIRELVDDSTGRLVPAEDVLALADALVEVLADPALARSLGIAARARAEQRRPAAEYEAGIARLAAWVRADTAGAGGGGVEPSP